MDLTNQAVVMMSQGFGAIHHNGLGHTCATDKRDYRVR